MSTWSSFIQTALEQMTPVCLDDLCLPEAHPNCVSAQEDWKRRHSKRNHEAEADGRSWPKCYQTHLKMREHLAERLPNVKVPLASASPFG